MNTIILVFGNKCGICCGMRSLRADASEMAPIEFGTDLSRYRHSRLAINGAVALPTLDVDARGWTVP